MAKQIFYWLYKWFIIPSKIYLCYQLLYNKMGIIPSTTDSQSLGLINTLSFVQEQLSNNFGQIYIYRRNEKPYDYYMRYTESYKDSKQTLQNINHKISLYSKLQGHCNIVQIEANSISKRADLCSDRICVDSYAKYHNYTLEQAIACKIYKKKYFREADLLYILQSLLSVGQKFSRVCGRHYKGLFKSSKVYLNTQGYVKVYPFHMLNTKAGNFSVSHEDKKNARVIYHEMEVSSPVKIRNSKEIQRQVKTEPNDLQDIGNLIVDLALLRLAKEDDMNKTMDRQTLQGKLKGRLSSGLKQIVMRVIYNNEGCSFKSFQSELQIFKEQQRIRAAYCICIQQDISVHQRQQIAKEQSQKDEQLSRRSQTSQNWTAWKVKFYKNASRVTED